MPPAVENNVEQSQYELIVDGQIAGVAEYRIEGDQIVFPHTEIAAARRGNGLGALLVRGALDDVRGSGRTVVPTCWFVAAFIEEHQEYADLLAS